MRHREREPEEEKPTRRRPGRLRRWFLRPTIWTLVLAVVAVTAVLALVHLGPVQERIVRRVLPLVEERLGREIRVGAVGFGILPLWVEARNVELAGPEPGEPAVLRADRIYVEADLFDLWRRSLSLQEVRAEGLEVFVERFGPGETNVPRPGAAGGADERDRGARRVDVDLDYVRVTDGSFRFRDHSIPMDLAARRVRLVLTGMGGVSLQGRVAAEEVDLDLPPLEPYAAAVSGRVVVDREGIVVREGAVVGPALDASVEGGVRWKEPDRVVFHVEAETRAELFRRLGVLGDEIDGSVGISGRIAWEEGVWGFRGALASERLRLLEWAVTDVSGRIAGDRNSVWVDLDDARYAGGEVEGRLEVSLGEDRVVETDLEVAEVDVERFLLDAGIPIEGIGGRMTGSATYRFRAAEWERGTGWAELRLRGEAGRERVPVTGTVPLVVEDGRIESRAIRITSRTGQAMSADAFYDIRRRAGVVDYRIESEDVGPLAGLVPVTAEDGGAPGWLPIRGRGTIGGRLLLSEGGIRAEVELDLEPAATPVLEVDRAAGMVVVSDWGVERLRLELGRDGRAALVTGTVPFEATEERPWRLGLDLARWPAEDARPWVELEVPVSGPFTGSVELRGWDEGIEGEILGSVRPALVGGIEIGTLDLDLGWTPEEVDVARAAVEAPAGILVARGTIGLDGGRLDLDLEARDLDLSGEPFADLLGGRITGSAALDATLGGRLEEPEIAGTLTARDLRVGDETVGGDGTAAIVGSWRGGRLTAEGSILGLASFEGGGELAEHAVDVAFDVEVPDLGIVAAVLGITEVPVSGRTRGEVTVVGAPASPEVEVTLTELRGELADQPVRALEPIRLSVEGDRIEIRSLYLGGDLPGSELFAAGTVELPAPHSLDLVVQSSLDNRWLRPWLPEVELTGMTDLLATVRGTVGDPVLDGQAEVRDAELLSLAFPQSIENLRAILLFDRESVILDTLRGDFGGGTVRAAGQMAWPFDESWPRARFQVAARDVTIRYPEGWLLSGDAELVWSLGEDGQALRGLVTLDRGYYLRDVEVGVVQLLQRFFRHQRQEVGETDERLAAVQLNVVVRAPGAVRVRNNLADLRGSAELTVRGSLARPIVFGRVEAEPGGTLVYGDNEYEIERATLNFANPYRVEPLLDLVADTEVADYDVTLSLFGNLDRLNASFSSDPPLPDLEVLSLLLAGDPGRLTESFATQTETGDQQTSAAESMLVGQAASLIGKRVGALFGFDAFRIEPLSSSGGSVSSARLTVGKRLSSDLYVTYSYDPSSTEQQRFRVEWQVERGLVLVFTQDGDSYAVDVLKERRF